MGFDHIVTQEDLDNNPQLVEDGVKVGDTIQVPETEEEQNAPGESEEVADAPPIVTGEVNHNLHEAEVLGYGEDGKPELKVGAVIGAGYLLTPERAEEFNFLAQRAPVGGTMRVYKAAE